MPGDRVREELNHGRQDGKSSQVISRRTPCRVQQGADNISAYEKDSEDLGSQRGPARSL